MLPRETTNANSREILSLKSPGADVYTKFDVTASPLHSHAVLYVYCFYFATLFQFSPLVSPERARFIILRKKKRKERKERESDSVDDFFVFCFCVADTENEVGDGEDESTYEELLRRLIKLEKVRQLGRTFLSR